MDAKEQVTAAPDVGRRPRREPPPGLLAAPLLPGPARRPAAIVAVCCLLLVASIGIATVHQTHGTALDRAVDSWSIGLHVPSHILTTLRYLGDGRSLTALVAVLAVACLLARRLPGAVLAVVSIPVAGAMTELVLKPLFHRTLFGSLSYPSGHTTGLFAVATVIAVVLLGFPASRPPRSVRLAVTIAAAVVAGTVGFVMIALHNHYFTDVIGGAAVGTGVALGVAFVLDHHLVRRWLGRVGR